MCDCQNGMIVITYKHLLEDGGENDYPYFFKP